MSQYEDRRDVGPVQLLLWFGVLDFVEGARRANLGAQVSRSNTRDQLQAAQQQAQFARQSQERMAIYQNAQQMQRLQAQGRMSAAQQQTQFQRQRVLGQDQFGQRQQLGDQGFGYSQQLQQQQDQEAAERQQAQFRQREIFGIMQTLDPQAQAQIRTINFQLQKAMDEQRKRPVYRPEEFQQVLQQFDQRVEEALQVAGRKPSLEEQFQQRGMWIDDPNSPGLQHYVGLDPKSGKLHKVIAGDQQIQQGPSITELNTWYNNRSKLRQYYRSQVTAGANGNEPVYTEQQIEQFVN